MNSIKLALISLILLSIVLTTESKTKNIKYHALLIGITYQNRKDITHLKGPINDVLAFNNLLLDRGFKSDDIHILSDGLAETTQPTRKAIFQAFNKLSNTLKKDDFVFLYFGGHGSFQPTVKDTTESDGRDEIFLPVDVGRWQGKTGPVKNAITDNEMGQLIANLRNSGAFVWAVFDQCHAGSMTRGETGKYRYLDPKLLGVPARRLYQNISTPNTRSEAKDIPMLKPTSNLTADAGNSVIFYATQPWEIEPELEVSDGEDGKQTFGMFSYRLLQILSTYPQASYNQIAQQLLQHYDASGRSRPTPLFTGSGMDAIVFNRNKVTPIRQWPIKLIEAGLVISAGHLQQLTEGSVLAIMRNPAAEHSLAYLKITKAGLFRSILSPVEYNGKAILKPSNTMYARLVYTQPRLTLRVANPQYSINSVLKNNKLRQVIKRIQSTNNNTLIKWVAPEQDADISLRIDESQLWLIPNGSIGIIKEGPYKNHSIKLIDSPDKLYVVLNDSLQRMAKAINLLRLASQFNDSILSDKLQITATIKRNDSQISQSFTPNSIPLLHQGDILTFTLENHSKLPVDITLLFMDSQYGIHSWHPKTDQINRIGAGDKVIKRLLITTETIGRERMLFIAVRADQFTPLSSDFRFLAQSTLPKSRSENSNMAYTKEQSQILALFQRAGFGETARSSQQTKHFLSDSKFSEKALIAGYSWVVE